MAKLSIIIPIYNAEQTLSRCIDSVLRQTLQDIEIILVNDGSTDRSLSICEGYARVDSRIILIQKKENQGLVAARKSGVEIASSELVTYIDSDDWVGLDAYQVLVSTLENEASDLVIAGHYVEEESGTTAVFGNLEPGTYPHEEMVTHIYPNLLADGYENGWTIFPYVWDKIFRRDILSSIQNNVPEEIKIGEDAAVTYPYFVRCKRISITRHCFYHYCKGKSSMLQKKSDFFADIPCYRSLYFFMQEAFSQRKETFPLIEQSGNCIMNNTILPRSPMLLQDVMKWEDLFPFRSSSKYRNIVVFGAGMFGNCLFQYLQQKRRWTLTAWLDSDREVQKSNPEVRPPEDIKGADYDCVLVAIINKKAQMDVIAKLESLGVERERILCADMEWVSREREKLFSFNLEVGN